MSTYQHTQRGTIIILVTLGMAAAIAVGAFCFKAVLFVPVAILLVTAWQFSSMTIEITGNQLRWHFGPGFIAKRVLLADITEVKLVQISFMEGWGIHWSRFGWLYNVAGYGALAITLRNGKMFALGTDEPEALRAIIQQNLR